MLSTKLTSLTYFLESCIFTDGLTDLRLGYYGQRHMLMPLDKSDALIRVPFVHPLIKIDIERKTSWS